MKQKTAYKLINAFCTIIGYKVVGTVVRNKPYWLIVKK